MLVSLLRHAIAVERGTASFPNDDRPLTEEGRKKMLRGAKGIVRVVPLPDLILTSPLQRARDTAVIVAQAFERPDLVTETKHLLPSATEAGLWQEVRKLRSLEHCMFVGHEPHLSSLAESLLASQRLTLEFKKGGLCLIKIPALPPRSAGSLVALLTPKHLRALA
jgi:phosphohistidine phosphatase